MSIRFCYLYRDGTNYKNFNEIIFSNPNSRSLQEIEKAIKENLIDGKWFYCSEWKIPDMHFKEFGYDPEIDVDWHEFETVEETTDLITEENSIEELLLLVNQTKLP